MKYEEILNGLTLELKHILKDNLVGIYVHGSIAMKCFNWDKSDIDFLIVVKKAPTVEVKRQVMDVIMKYNLEAPPKGIEMSMVLEEACRNFVYPTPFELHYSNMHRDWYKSAPEDYCTKMCGVDRDLAAHFTITKKYGITWCGRAIQEVFGEVKEEYYLDSISHDVSEAESEILENPVYIILNLCRVAAYIKNKLILSKEQGGVWGMENLKSEFSPLVKEALTSYRSYKEMKSDKLQCQKFAKYMLNSLDK